MAERRCRSGVGSADRSAPSAEGQLDLGFAFYVNDNWNLKAGADVIARFGTVTPDAGGSSESFTTIDAATSAGFGYTW